MRGAGEQQRAQHAFHQGLLEIHLPHRTGDFLGDLQRRIEMIDDQDHTRGGQGDDHQADGVRQLEQMVV